VIARLRNDPMKKALLVMVLPCVAGAVNGSGLFEVGAYTSHMTGNTARLGHEVAQRHWADALLLGGMVFAFMLGAVVGAAVVERSKRQARAHYALGLWLEALFLAVVAGCTLTGRFHVPGAELILLCLAMGLQNALITRLSGAVVRTTHVTGIVTDIGIELVHLWLLMGERAQGRLRLFALGAAWRDPAVDPLKLHCTLWCSFVAGNLLGAALFLRFGFASLLLPIAVVAGLAVFDQRAGLDLPAATSQPAGR
jgi:uncharacterized membrane protein YoaK (UPF0700 family)